MTQVSIQQLMQTSGVKFGTSGARGLVVDMTDRLCFAYVQGFLYALSGRGELKPGQQVAIGGDLRPSTPRIMAAAAAAVNAFGARAVYLGQIPSPAVALYGLNESCPTVMVTGSHIPEDRNGMKFTTAAGEVTKADESLMLAQQFELDESLFDQEGALLRPFELGEPDHRARSAYQQRYIQAFGRDALSGLKVGVYGHSAVGRDLLVEIYRALGAEVTELGFSDTFVPVDTEAIRAQDHKLAQDWAREAHFDSIVSTDGDSDRPLTSDENGRFLRGDISGIITCQYFGVKGVALPVSCNEALEAAGFAERVLRSKIGSPYVIEKMQELLRAGVAKVAGYEANGGFLQASPFTTKTGAVLAALPTRDAVIVHLAVLLQAKEAGVKISHLLARLPQRFTASDRDQSFVTERSLSLLTRLREANASERELLLENGAVDSLDETDGLRIYFENGEVLHLRPSGNAPELRCYAEATSQARASELVAHGLHLARRLAPEIT